MDRQQSFSAVSGGPYTEARAATAGVIGRMYLVPMVAVTGELAGLSVNREFKAAFVDASLYGTVSVGRYVGVQGGYRSIAIDQRVGEDRYDLKMKGPYLGAAIRF